MPNIQAKTSGSDREISGLTTIHPYARMARVAAVIADKLEKAYS
jgi:hypothetical protein